MTELWHFPIGQNVSGWGMQCGSSSYLHFWPPKLTSFYHQFEANYYDVGNCVVIGIKMFPYLYKFPQAGDWMMCDIRNSIKLLYFDCSALRVANYTPTLRRRPNTPDDLKNTVDCESILIHSRLFLSEVAKTNAQVWTDVTVKTSQCLNCMVAVKETSVWTKQQLLSILISNFTF